MLPLTPGRRKPSKMFLEQIMLPDLTSSTELLNYTVTGKILFRCLASLPRNSHEVV